MPDIILTYCHYEPPLVGPYGCVGVCWRDERTPTRLYTRRVLVEGGGLCYEDVQDLPLAVLEAIAATLPDAPEE